MKEDKVIRDYITAKPSGLISSGTAVRLNLFLAYRILHNWLKLSLLKSFPHSFHK